MKKTSRITNGIEFQEIINKKKYIANKSFVIYYMERKEENSRVGISVGKKIGKAHVRNKVKRQVRMMFQDLLKHSLNQDMICIIRAGYCHQSFEENKKLLENLVFKVNIIVDET